MKIRQYFSREDIAVQTVESSEIPVYGRRMSVMMLSGAELRITFKVQYNYGEVLRLGLNLIQDENTDIPGLMNEFSNITVGYIKSVLEKKGIKIGTSLPISTRAFDEVFHQAPVGECVLQPVWGLAGGGNSLTCLAIIQVFDQNVFKKMEGLQSEIASGADSAGEADFL